MHTAQSVTSGDPRLSWSSTETGRAPRLQHRRDGILPAVAAALSVRGETLTCTAGKGDQPPVLHPLVQDFLDTLPSSRMGTLHRPLPRGDTALPATHRRGIDPLQACPAQAADQRRSPARPEALAAHRTAHP